MKNFFYHLFVPNDKNNHKAFLIQPSFLGVFIAIYILNLSLIKTFTIVKPGVLGYSSEITAQSIFEKTNIERRNSGLDSLHYNSLLSESATKKAQDMFESNYWAHNSPSGKSPWEFFKLVGYDYSIAGENLAKDFSDNDSVINAWMKSPTHKANIIHTKYKEIGIGVVQGNLNGVKTTLVVQHFATPQDGVSLSSTTPDEKTFNAYPYGSSDTSSQVLSVVDKKISPIFLVKTIGTVFFIIIMLAVFIDGYVTIKNNTHRLSGSATGHIGFLVIIFIMMLMLEQGKIF